MDEDAYRSTYNSINPQRCIFEKTITNRRCDCCLKRKFTLATREGVACESKAALDNCTDVLAQLRHNSRFSLKVTSIDGPMPHNKELQVQAGGITALNQLLVAEGKLEKTTLVDIHQTVKQALSYYKSINNLPFGDIVKGIVSYQSRPRRKKQ